LNEGWLSAALLPTLRASKAASPDSKGQLAVSAWVYLQSNQLMFNKHLHEIDGLYETEDQLQSIGKSTIPESFFLASNWEGGPLKNKRRNPPELALVE
jgi:hypothetical protein